MYRHPWKGSPLDCRHVWGLDHLLSKKLGLVWPTHQEVRRTRVTTICNVVTASKLGTESDHSQSFRYWAPLGHTMKPTFRMGIASLVGSFRPSIVGNLMCFPMARKQLTTTNSNSLPEFLDFKLVGKTIPVVGAEFRLFVDQSTRKVRESTTLRSTC